MKIFAMVAVTIAFVTLSLPVYISLRTLDSLDECAVTLATVTVLVLYVSLNSWIDQVALSICTSTPLLLVIPFICLSSLFSFSFNTTLSRSVAIDLHVEDACVRSLVAMTFTILCLSSISSQWLAWPLKQRERERTLLDSGFSSPYLRSMSSLLVKYHTQQWETEWTYTGPNQASTVRETENTQVTIMLAATRCEYFFFFFFLFYFYS